MMITSGSGDNGDNRDQCHDSPPTTKPEMVGPINGANMMTSPNNLIAPPRCLGGYLIMMAFIVSGFSMPVPIA
jgi:hypothetical protein